MSRHESNGPIVPQRRRRARRRPDPAADRGALLVLTVVLVTVFSFMLVALANYSVTGVRTSTATQRTAVSAAGARLGVDFALFQYRTGAWAPCTSVEALAVPEDLREGLTSLTITCAPNGELDGHAVVIVASQAVSESSSTTLMAKIQVGATGGAALLATQRS
ncbi:MAG: hypothetical protein R2715_12745 [Ilumatobacteraceae bacterium]